MIRNSRLGWMMTLLLAVGATVPAHAQWAVFDVASVTQLMTEVQTLNQQLQTAQSQLTQAQQQYQAITGNRGMAQLLGGQNRNYLPTSGAELAAALQGTSGPFGALSATVQTAVQTNAVLTPAQIAGFSAAEQVDLNSSRRSAALLQGLTSQALLTTSTRFSTLQQLISAISSANDAKAVLDLQARATAEQAMLTNDQSKLQTLYQAAQAQQWVLQQRLDERAIADVGSLRMRAPLGL
jgi:type IV secretion system protein VirB5